MQLHYVWIEKYQAIEQEGFCFSPDFDIKFDPESKTLTVAKKEQLLPRSFWKVGKGKQADVFNVSALVGKNGVGKTTVLKFLWKRLLGGMNTFRGKFDEREFLIVYRNRGSGKLILYSTLKERPVFDEKMVELVDDANIADLRNKWSEEHSVLVYSNVFSGAFRDEGEKKGNRNGFISHSRNLSSGYLIRDAKEVAYGTRSYGESDLGIFRSVELQKQIGFLRSDSSDLLPFDLPGSVGISIVRVDEQSLGRDEGNFRPSPFFKVLGKILDFIEEERMLFSDRRTGRGLSPHEAQVYKESFQFELEVAILCNAIRDNRNHLFLEENVGKGEELLATYNKGKFSKFFDRAMGFILGILRKHKEMDSYQSMRKKVERRISALEAKRELYGLLKRQYTGQDHWQMQLAIGEKKQWNRFQKMFDLYKKSLYGAHYLSFRWRALSSGEEAMLSLFSRFHSTLSGDLGKQLLILIDEGSAFYHPEWQRRFMHSILKFLPRLFPGKTLQIIIATNTPLLISDFPKSNVIRMQGKLKGEIPRMKQTFAANIHSLFKDSFFLESTMGEFAKQRLQSIVVGLKKLRSKGELSEEDKKWLLEAEKTIVLVGEPVLQRKLKDLYEECAGKPFGETLEGKKARLEAELREISSQLEGGKDAKD